MPLVKYASRTPVMWANGGGTTVELVSLNTSCTLTPALPQWRLSIASLKQPAKFSPLPGMMRQFMPVDGTVILSIDGNRTTVAAGTVCHFNGASAVELIELSNPCHAVNLMIEERSGDAATLQLSYVTAGAPAPAPPYFAVRLADEPTASRFDLTHLEDAEAALGYEAACTGPWAAIAKS